MRAHATMYLSIGWTRPQPASGQPARHSDGTLRRERPGTAHSTGPVLTDTGTSPAQSRPAASRAPTGAHARHPLTEAQGSK